MPRLVSDNVVLHISLRVRSRAWSCRYLRIRRSLCSLSLLGVTLVMSLARGSALLLHLLAIAVVPFILGYPHFSWTVVGQWRLSGYSRLHTIMLLLITAVR
jgi:hypothetical protein